MLLFNIPNHYITVTETDSIAEDGKTCGEKGKKDLTHTEDMI